MAARCFRVRTLVLVILLASCRHGSSLVQQAPAAPPSSGVAVASASPAAAVVDDAVGPAPDTADAAAPATAVTSGDDPDYSFYDQEAIGPLHARMTDKELIAVLGAPRAKQPASEEGATGAWVSSWTWRGASALMVADTKKGPWQARDVSVSAPSSYATKRGGRIGTTRAEVERLYPR